MTARTAGAGSATVATDSDVATEPPTPTPGRELIPLFIGLILAMLLAALNQTVLATALPTMVGELNGVEHMSWVITAYILASTVMMPVYGKLGDLIGRKRLLLAAICMFMVGSVFGGAAGDMTWLIVGRVIQGLGGGGLIILSQAIIADVVPARERGKYMGVMGAVFAFASIAGPLLGGWFTEGPGWRWTFWINLPLGALALLVAARFLHLPRTAGGGARPRLDLAGMALLAATTICLVLVGTWAGSRYAWTSPTVLGLLAGTVAAGALFVVAERRAAAPIVPLHLFRNRNFNLTTIAGLLIGVAMFGSIAYLPTYLQMATGTDATIAGLLMIPMMGGLLVTSVVAGFYVSRTGRYKWLPIAGAGAVAGALLLMSTITLTMPVWVVCLYLTLLGVGLGASMQLLVLIVQDSFPARQVGTATGANNFFRQVGASLGAAVIGSLFASRLLTELGQRLPEAATVPDGVGSLTPELLETLPAAVRQPVVASYHEALTPLFLFMMPVGLVAAALLLFLVEKPLSTRIDREEPAADSPAAEPETPADAPAGAPTEVAAGGPAHRH